MRMSARAAAVTGLAAIIVAGVATTASAHVTANPDTAAPGSYTKVSFRVPNEEPSGDTTKVVIDLPTDHPIASVSVRPVPGWTITVAKTKLATPIKSDDAEVTQAVSQITWSGGKIAPGQFQEFEVSLGPLPTNTDRLLFKAHQTYSTGEVVNWEQDPGNGGQEPEHPAPMLRLVATSTATSTHMPSAAGAAKTTADDGTARLLGGVGIAVGVIGLVVGGYGLARARSGGSSS